MRTLSTSLLFSGVMVTFHPHGLNEPRAAAAAIAARCAATIAATTAATTASNEAESDG
jgi:hypothetical protein